MELKFLRRPFDHTELYWKTHKVAYRAGLVPVPFLPHKIESESTRSVLLLSHDNTIARSQIYPFFYYSRQLHARYQVLFRELSIDAFLKRKFGSGERADIVLVQPWFTIGGVDLIRLLEQVLKRCRPSHVVFLDCSAPADLRHAIAVTDLINIYVKKHALRDRSLYGKPTRGDTNLTDYVVLRYGIDLPEVCFEVPQRFLDKLVVGPSFFTADYLLRAFRRGEILRKRPRYDLHARLGRKGSPFYEILRNQAMDALQRIGGIVVLTEFGVSKERYLGELAQSRICFSPFGYGEVAWRDYEAVLYGSLLLKQDTSHLETDPDIFVNGETYVAVRWDFADLESKIRYYLAHENERRRISENAFRILRDYARREQFVDQVSRLFVP